MSEGDAEAFRIIFDAYRDRLYFFTLRITSSPETAEDIVQDTFLKIWIMRDRLTRVQYFGTYIFRMAQNAVMNGLKRKALESVIVAEKLAPPESEKTADEQLHFKHVRKVIEETVDGLPARQKMAFKLRREEGKKVKEIAALMNISEETVKGTLSKAQKTIREAIELNFPLDSAILIIILGLVVNQ